MKPIAKLIFVALLIGVALNLPVKVRSQGTSYTCNAQFPICEQSVEQWMNQCAWDCTMNATGTPTPVCASVPYGDCELTSSKQYKCVTAMNSICPSAPSGGASCVADCETQFTPQYNQCVAQFCTTG